MFKETVCEEWTGLLSQQKTQDLGSAPKVRRASAVADGGLDAFQSFKNHDYSGSSALCNDSLRTPADGAGGGGDGSLLRVRAASPSAPVSVAMPFSKALRILGPTS